MVEHPPNLYVASATRQSFGKTAFCLGLALQFKEIGLNVGYFKPLGWQTASVEGRPADEDAILMKHVLKLGASTDSIAPILLRFQYLDQYPTEQAATFLNRIDEAYQRVSKGRDLMIMEALHEPCLGASINLCTATLASHFNSKLLLISSVYQDVAVDEILSRKCCEAPGKVNYAGVVFNRIPKPVDERIRNVVIPALEKRGVHVWGLVPESAPLTAPTVKDLMETLGGNVLCGKEHLSNLVEHYLVGAMTQDSAIRYFRKASGKAVITGGDRPDIALAALETDTSVLVLTGDIYPNAVVLAKAGEKGVPIILVPYDTYTTVERVRDVAGKIKVGDDKRIKMAKKLVSENVDWKGLLSYLGLPS